MNEVKVYNIFETRRGIRCIDIDNYKFNEYRVLMSEYSRIHFRCTNTKCSASIIVNKLKTNL